MSNMQLMWIDVDQLKGLNAQIKELDVMVKHLQYRVADREKTTRHGMLIKGARLLGEKIARGDVDTETGVQIYLFLDELTSDAD